MQIVFRFKSLPMQSQYVIGNFRKVMKHIIIFFTTLLLSSCLQESKVDNLNQTKDSLQQTFNKLDSTFTPVNLKDISKLQDTSKEQTVVVVEIGQKATIYLNAKLLRQSALELLYRSNYMDEYSKIIRLLDLHSINDTFFIGPQGLPNFEYVISAQLQKGNAKVFYNKKKSFVPIIYHRLERYEACEYRFFYLPDQRPFFSEIKLSGILEGGALFERKDPKEFKELREKIEGLRDE